MIVWLFLAVPWFSLRFMIVVFPDPTHLLLLQGFFIKPTRKFLNLQYYQLKSLTSSSNVSGILIPKHISYIQYKGICKQRTTKAHATSKGLSVLGYLRSMSEHLLLVVKMFFFSHMRSQSLKVRAQPSSDATLLVVYAYMNQ